MFIAVNEVDSKHPQISRSLNLLIFKKAQVAFEKTFQIPALLRSSSTCTNHVSSAIKQQSVL